MKVQLIEAMINSLHVKTAHIKPNKAVEGLTPSNARSKPEGEYHSCWDLLHHIVVWQEGILRGIKGEKVDWKDIGEHHDWPTSELMSDDSNFINLVKKFKNGLKEAEEIAKTVDWYKEMPSWRGASIIEAFIVLLQHNSYHLGQLVAVRKILGDWPT
ncbi:MAG: DinB family protein [Candidatus Hodarchaeota archaeon]